MTCLVLVVDEYVVVAGCDGEGVVCLDGEFPDEGGVGVPDVDVVNSGDTIGCEENVSGLEVFSFDPFAVSCDPEQVMISRRDTASVGEGDVGDLVGVQI